MPKGLRLPKEATQDVPSLFPNAIPHIDPEQEAFYRQVIQDHGAYVLAVDRQSEHKQLGSKDHTGQARRVEAIKGMAKAAGWLKEPEYIKKREDGQLAYIFDRNFWFLDGETKNATGYAASPHARPEFWRAYLLAQGLAALGCGPAAFILGEGTRLFRDTVWLNVFCRSLWDAKIRIFVGNFGEVTDNNIAGLAGMVKALSSWLPEARRGARVDRKRANRLLQVNDIHSAVYSNEEGTEIYARPDVWPHLVALVEQMADGRLKTFPKAAAWLKEQGVDRSVSWLRQLMHDRPILDGYYDSHRLNDEARKLRSRPLTDLDMTPSGNRRYLRHPAPDPLLLPINFEHNGMTPIPPNTLAQARARIKGPGRPPSPERLPGLFLSGNYCRCAVCGGAITETIRYRPSVHHELRCRGPQDHKRYAPVPSPLSGQVWSLLVEGVEASSYIPTESGSDEEAEEKRLQGRLAELDAGARALRANLGRAEWDDETLEDFRRQLAEIATSKQAVQLELNTLATAMLQRRQSSQNFHQFQQILRAYHEELDDQGKGSLIASIVSRIEVHLEEGWFRVHVNVTAEALQGLGGGWDSKGWRQNHTSFIWCAVLPPKLGLVLEGRIAA